MPKRERRRPPVGERTDHRLQQRRRDLIRERDGAELQEVERERQLQVRIDGRQERLQHVVAEMTVADGDEHAERGCRARRTQDAGANDVLTHR